MQESYGIGGLEALLSNCALIATPGLVMDTEYACEPTIAAIQKRIIAYLSDVEQLREDQKAQIFRNSVNRPKFTLGKMCESYINVWQELHKKLQKEQQ